MSTATTNESEAQARQAPPPASWLGVERVHLMGICGSAMGALAQMLVRSGLEVRGSDKGAYPPMSTTLDALGIQVMEGYHATNLDWAPDLVVVGNVIGPFNPEAIALRASGIPHCSLPQAICERFIQSRLSVVITGTHGKTSTSSMTAWLLHQAGRDPGFMIGGVTGNFESNHRVSEGPTFVVEGDEYDTAYWDKGPKFLHYRPMVASINNIEFDHADIFADLAAVEATFARFAHIVPSEGRLIVPADDPIARRLAEQSPAQVWTFGIDTTADIEARELEVHEAGTSFSLHLPQAAPQRVSLPLWGEHNLRNALTAAGLAYAAGADAAQLAEAFASFRLPRKRQELRGSVADIPVIDDFAHHPTAIRETLRATRQRYPGRRVLALFEVESNTSRRRTFQEAFRAAFREADRVWFGRPLEKADGLTEEERLDLPRLAADLNQDKTPTSIVYETQALAEAVVTAAQPQQDVIIAMSGRDFDGLHDKILSALKDRFER